MPYNNFTTILFEIFCYDLKKKKQFSIPNDMKIAAKVTSSK